MLIGFESEQLKIYVCYVTYFFAAVYFMHEQVLKIIVADSTMEVSVTLQIAFIRMTIERFSTFVIDPFGKKIEPIEIIVDEESIENGFALFDEIVSELEQCDKGLDSARHVVHSVNCLTADNAFEKVIELRKSSNVQLHFVVVQPNFNSVNEADLERLYSKFNEYRVECEGAERFYFEQNVNSSYFDPEYQSHYQLQFIEFEKLYEAVENVKFLL